MRHFQEFDKYGRYIESPCFGCDMDDCKNCPRIKQQEEETNYENIH